MGKMENGNSQLNSLRCEFNNRIERKFILGSGKRITWNNTRRHRTI
jgi:hypothetical protein